MPITAENLEEALKENPENEEIEVKIEDEEKPDDAEGEAAPKNDAEAKKKTDEEAEKSPKKKKTHRGNNANQQINKLWGEVQDKDRALLQTQQQLESERAARVKMEGMVGQTLEEKLKSDKQWLTSQLKDATLAQDADAISKITSEMSDTSARLAQIDRWKVENDVKTKEASKVEQRQPQNDRAPRDLSFDDIYEGTSPSGKAWLDTNRDWFDKDSENHNQEMVADIVTKAQNLEDQWRKSGKGSDVGTRAYYRELDKYLQENWSENDDEEEAAPVQKPRAAYAAPVNSRQAPGQQQAPKRNVITLSKDERDLAINMTRKHLDGRDFTDAEKIKDFASNKELTKNMKPGDTINVNTIRRGA